jgi:ubiquinone/menaquinone biosynthesis C-methylase UbiE
MLDIESSRTKISKKISEYWAKRSESYSRQNIAELHCFKGEAWKKLILENAPNKHKLKILDVGTGPGFFAINLALSGHDVTAVDCTHAMLVKAIENAMNYGVNVKFKMANVNELPFGDDTFDLIVSRNVIWNLENPQKALKEWARVLNDEGRLIYYDANWYLYLFDEQLQKKIELSKREADRLFPEETDPPQCLSIKMEEIAYNLPLSREHRPQWDRETLGGCGFRLIAIDENIGDSVWDKKEKIRFAETPIFMVCAEKKKAKNG